MQFVKESRVAASPTTVFAFHESPGALERLTPPWESVKILESAGSLQVGSRIRLRTWLGLVPVDWVVEHTEYDPPHGFADRQVRGPFTSWSHRHRFRDDGNGGTWIRDELDFEPPLGPVGQLLGGPFLVAKLQKLFDYRHEVTRRIVEAGDFSQGSRGESPAGGAGGNRDATTANGKSFGC
jgi:ligand-binding SRPBCC domain-containing protein